MEADPRLTPARPDLAAEHLRGTVEAPRYAAGERCVIIAPLADLFAAPGDATLASQLLHGEAFTVYDGAGGLAWGQCGTDGYVGYVFEAALAPAGPAPTHRVRSLGAQVYTAPGLKQTPLSALPWQALVMVEAEADGYARIGGGWCPAQLLAPVDSAEADCVAAAERLLGVPYLWGGRSQAGLDCSALVQLTAATAGIPLPRDSDLQASCGAPVGGARARGDLVFWRGHVGLLTDADTLLHANVHHMCVTREPLAEAEARIAATDTGGITAIRRLDKEASA